jgi:hypothetical protein
LRFTSAQKIQVWTVEKEERFGHICRMAFLDPGVLVSGLRFVCGERAGKKLNNGCH